MWNSRQRVDRQFLCTTSAPFEPHTTYGIIPDEVLEDFCCNREDTFLGAPCLMQHFDGISMDEGDKSVVKQLNLFHVTFRSASDGVKRAMFKYCPLV